MQEFDLYEESFKSAATKKVYTEHLEKFLEVSKLDLKTADPKVVKAALTNYVITMKKKGLSRTRQNQAVCAIQKWYKVNDIDVTFSNVRTFMSEDGNTHSDRLYTLDELRRMIGAADLRLKAIILLLVSSGMRSGALGELQLKHLLKLASGIYKITVYPSSKKDAYITFCSPEAAQSIDAYLEWRKQRGEVITPESPLFRQAFNESSANVVTPITRNTISICLSDLTLQLGVRKLFKSKAEHNEMRLTHSFRKQANTAFIKSGMPLVVCEKLLGHSIKLQDNYLRLDADELAAYYLKAVPLLTISNEKALAQQVKKLKLDTASIQEMKATMLQQAAQIETMATALKRLGVKDLDQAGEFLHSVDSYEDSQASEE